MSKESLKLVVFTLETENAVYEYGIPIRQVHEITRKGKTTKLPGTPEFLDGVMNLRGSIIPIIDLKKRCGLGVTYTKDTTRIVVIENKTRKCGVVVDDVVEIVAVGGENIDEPPAIAGGISSNYISGLCKVDDRLIIALDMETILTDHTANKEAV